MKKRKTSSQEISELKARLAETEELLSAIKSGAVDAFITDDQRVFTLKGADRAYRVLVETINEGAATLAYDGTIMYCNRHLAKMLGFKPEEIIGKSILDVVNQGELSKFKSILRQSRDKNIRAEFQFKRKGKSLFPALISCNSLEIDTKGLCIVIRDLTEQKRIEFELKEHRDQLEELVKERTKKLAESEERFRSLSETSLLGVGVSSADGVLLYTNPAYESLLGYTQGELLGKKAADLYLNPDDRSSWLKTIKEGGAVRDAEIRLKRKDGAPVWVSVNISHIQYDGKQAIMGSIQDITERKRLEKALQARSQEQEAILDSTPALIFYKDKENRFLRVNKAFADAMGLPKKDLEGKPLYELYPRQAADDYWKDDLEVIKSGKPKRNIIETMDTPQGVRIVQTDKISYRDEEGNAKGIIGFAVDITERKQAEEELAHARSLLAESQKIAHLGSFEYVVATRTTIWSEEEYRIYGLDPAGPSPEYDVMLAKCIHSDDAGLLHETFTKAMQRLSVYELEHRIIRPDGTVRWVFDRAHPYFDENGKVLRYVGATLDITERKYAEDALRESEESLKRAQSVGSIGSWQLNVKTNELVWSDENYRIFGVPEGAPQTYESFLSLVHPEDREHADRKWKAAMAGEDYDVEHRIIADGRVKWVREKAYLEFDKKGTLLAGFGITQDITVKKEAEEVLRRDKETFEKLVKEKTAELIEAHIELDRAKRLSDIGVLAATVAHELRNPLAAIGLAAYNIKRKANNPNFDKHLANIDRKVTESDQIINNLLFYSRLKPSQFETINILDILEESITLIEDGRHKKDISIIRNMDLLKDISLEADPHQIKEVFSNVLNNATDAVPPEKGEIRVIAEIDDEFITIRIEDNGPGISQDIIDKVFDPFFTTKARGTGLGLAVCRQIINMHGGDIGIKKGLTNGTSVFVRLPKERISGL